MSDPVVVVKYRCGRCNGRQIGAIRAVDGRRVFVLHRTNSHAGMPSAEVPEESFIGEWCLPVEFEWVEFESRGAVLAVSCRHHGQWFIDRAEAHNNIANAKDVTLQHPLKELKLELTKNQPG